MCDFLLSLEEVKIQPFHLGPLTNTMKKSDGESRRGCLY